MATIKMPQYMLGAKIPGWQDLDDLLEKTIQPKTNTSPTLELNLKAKQSDPWIKIPTVEQLEHAVHEGREIEFWSLIAGERMARSPHAVYGAVKQQNMVDNGVWMHRSNRVKVYAVYSRKKLNSDLVIRYWSGPSLKAAQFFVEQTGVKFITPFQSFVYGETDVLDF